jgi:hypothetical protein
MESKIERKYILTLTEAEFAVMYRAVNRLVSPKKPKKPAKEDIAVLENLQDDMCDIRETLEIE